MYQEMQPEHKHVSVKLVFLISLVVFILAVVIYFVLTYSDRNNVINHGDEQMSIWLAETSPSERRPEVSSGELEAYLEETSPTEKIAGEANIEAFLEETSVESN